MNMMLKHTIMEQIVKDIPIDIASVEQTKKEVMNSITKALETYDPNIEAIKEYYENIRREDLPLLLDVLRHTLLFSNAIYDSENECPREAEQYYLLVLTSLEQAERYAQIAYYNYKKEKNNERS